MNDRIPSDRRRRATILAAVTVLVGLVAAGGLWFAARPTDQQLFRQGLAAGRQDPAAGERLLRRALTAAGGRYPDAQLALCDALARQGRWDEALAALATVEIEACRADLLVAFGRGALEAGYKSQGLETLQQAASRGVPASVTALELLKTEYHDTLQQDAETKVDYELARLDSDNPERWKSLIDALTGQRQYPECEAVVRQALDIELPDWLRGNFEYLLIQLLIARGEMVEPWRRLANLKTIEGQSMRVSLTEIVLLRFEGRYDLAQSKAAALVPETRDLFAVYQMRGTLHLDLEQYADAARDLERAVALRPFDEAIHFHLSQAYRALRQEELSNRHGTLATEITSKRKRINDLKGKLSEQPQNRALIGELAGLYQELGEDQSARYWRERADRSLQAQSKARR